MNLREIIFVTVRGFPIAAMLLAVHSAKADSTLWYNGDYDNRDALGNYKGAIVNVGGTPTSYSSAVYDDFIVPAGQTWTISSVFSNNQFVAPYSLPTSATWSIRTGVSGGNGGTVVASGSNAATLTAVTPVPGNYYIGPEYLVTTSTSPVVLTSGTYFLAVTPNAPEAYYDEFSYIETTSGQNAVGLPPGNNGNSYITSNNPSPGNYNFESTATVEAGAGAGSPPWDYSMGVAGTFQVIPEPSVLSLSAGMIGLAALRRRRSAR